MKKLLLFATLILGAVSCMKDQSFDANVGGETDVVLSVALPSDVTRAMDNDSAKGAIGNINLAAEYDIRYILEVFDASNTKAKRVEKFEDFNTSTTFELRLIPGRDYTFVVWADFVAQGSEAALHYNAEDLRNIEIIGTQNAMDESRDAYTGTFFVEKFSSSSQIGFELKRPFAKLRVMTNDIDEIYSELVGATIEYTAATYQKYDALTKQSSELVTKTKTVDYTSDAYLYAGEPTTQGEQTLFADYILGTQNGTVQFIMTVEDSVQPLPAVNFNTAIPVQANYLTTIYGPILTDYNQATVTINPAFENEGNFEESPYYQAAVTNGVELIKALMAGKEVIALNDITVTAADLAEATRAAAAVYPVINLNGFTITIENENADALVNLNGGTLTVQGEGAIVSNSGALVEGTTVVTEGATVDAEAAVDENGDSAVKTGVEALAYICENGGEFTFTENLAISEVLLASTANPIVINGADFTLTSSASRAIRATVANANIVVNDLNIDVTTERVGSNDIRGISVDNVTGVELTLNNCSVIFSHPSGNDWAYAVNVTGGSNHKVTVNGGTYNGANVINVRGEKQTVIVKNATLTSLYPNNDVYYGACIYVVQNENSSVYAEGNTFNGDNALAFNIGYTPIEEKNNTNNAKRVSAKVNGAYYYNIAEAIAAAEDGATITVLQNHDCNVGATVPAGKTLTIDLNKKTVKGTDTITGSFGLITNKGNLLVKNGKMTLKAENNRGWNAYSSVLSNTVGGNLVVENATIEHLGGTDMAYGIDNLTNGKGTYAETTVNEGAVVKSTYRAIRQFLNGIEAQNILTVNAGAVVEGANKSIWMQDPSKNANTGKLVVNEGATLNGDVYLFVTAGSTEWPVEVSIAASAVNGEVLTGNVPAGYEVVEKDGVWTVVAYTKVANTDELIAALKACQPIILTDDITVTSKWDNRYTGAKTSKAITIDGNGKTLKFACEINDGYNHSAAFRFEAPAVVKNLTIDMSEVTGTGSWLRAISTKGDITVDNCTFIGSTNYTSGRGIAFGEGAGAAISEVIVSVTNSTFTNWTRRGITDNENAQDAKSVTISNNVCTNAHVYVSAHDSIVFTGNTMENSAANFRSYTSAADATVVATGNTLDAALVDYNIIRGFAAANVECQEGFTVL